MYQITIKSQQSHITQFNRVEVIESPLEAIEFLREWLDKLNYSQDSEITLNDGDFYDTGDYVVSVEIL